MADWDKKSLLQCTPVSKWVLVKCPEEGIYDPELKQCVTDEMERNPIGIKGQVVDADEKCKFLTDKIFASLLFQNCLYF